MLVFERFIHCSDDGETADGEDGGDTTVDEKQDEEEEEADKESRGNETLIVSALIHHKLLWTYC